MEQGKELKEILMKGAQLAPPHFTDSIMKKVTGLAANPLPYQPLVSSKLKRRFVFIFVVLASLILLLGLLTHLPSLPFIGRMEIPPLSVYTYYRVLLFILSFWLVFAANAFVQRRLLSRTTLLF